MTLPFFDIEWPWRSLKVKSNIPIGLPKCGFLLVCKSKHMSICHCLVVIGTWKFFPISYTWQWVPAVFPTHTWHTNTCTMMLRWNVRLITTGTPEERGIAAWRHKIEDTSIDPAMASSRCYDFPFGMSAIRRWSWTKYIPVCPTFRGHRCRKEPDTVKHDLDEPELEDETNPPDGARNSVSRVWPTKVQAIFFSNN